MNNLIQEHQRMADKIRSGEYFEETRDMYNIFVHDPMAERYFYVLITIISLLAFLLAYNARDGIYPLNSAIPFVYSPNDLLEDLPHIKKLSAYKDEDPGEGVLRYIVSNYILLRETYKIEDYDRYVSGVKNQSSPEVVNEFERAADPRNPESPIALYQRHSKREISVLSTKRLYDQDYGMEVIFEAAVTGQGEIKKSRWKADIAFQYSGVTLDEETGKVKPLNFMVTKYQAKRLQDSK